MSGNMQNDLSLSKILFMGVTELRSELKKREIAIPPKSLKNDLQNLLKASISNCI